MVGGYGSALVPNGLHGSTTEAAGFGVVAANSAPSGGTGATGGRCGRTPAGRPAGTHVAGELYVDKDGTLWFSVPTAPGATTVKFVQLAATTTSGAFHAIAPQRAYDSRLAAYTPNGLLAPNTSRVVSVKDGHNAAGAVNLVDAVPVGATAVEINLTAADPTDRELPGGGAG